MDTINEIRETVKQRLSELDEEKARLERALGHITGDKKTTSESPKPKGRKPAKRKSFSWEKKEKMVLDAMGDVPSTIPFIAESTKLSKTTVKSTLERMAKATPPRVIKAGVVDTHAGGTPATAWQKLMSPQGVEEGISTGKHEPQTTASV